MLTVEDVRDMAAEFGAKRFRGDHTSPAYQSWRDRIELLPMMAERGEAELAAAIADADRYA